MAVEVREFKGSYGVFVDGELRTRSTSIDVATEYAATLDGSTKPRKIIVDTKTADQVAAENAKHAAGKPVPPAKTEPAPKEKPAKKSATRKRGATRKKKAAGF